MRIVNDFFKIRERALSYVSDKVVLGAVIGNAFPIAYLNILIYLLSEVNIIPHILINFKIFWCLFISFLIIMIYSAFAEVIYKTKKEMQINVKANIIGSILSSIGFFVAIV